MQKAFSSPRRRMFILREGEKMSKKAKYISFNIKQNNNINKNRYFKVLTDLKIPVILVFAFWSARNATVPYTRPFSGGIRGLSTLGLMSPAFIRAFFVIRGPKSS